MPKNGKSTSNNNKRNGSKRSARSGTSGAGKKSGKSASRSSGPTAGPRGGCAISHRAVAGHHSGSVVGALYTRLVVHANNTNVFGGWTAVFKQYNLVKFRRLTFKWVPTCSTRVGGRVGIGLSASTTDPDKRSMGAIMNAGYSAWANMGDPRGCTLSAPELNRAGMRQGYYTINQDATTLTATDILGVLHVYREQATNPEATATFPAGELLVEFEVELKEPIFSDQRQSVSGSILGGHHLGDKDEHDTDSDKVSGFNSSSNPQKIERHVNDYLQDALGHVTPENIALLAQGVRIVRILSDPTSNIYTNGNMARKRSVGSVSGMASLVQPDWPYYANSGYEGKSYQPLAFRVATGDQPISRQGGYLRLKYTAVYSANEPGGTPNATTYQRCIPALIVSCYDVDAGAKKYRIIQPIQRLTVQADSIQTGGTNDLPQEYASVSYEWFIPGYDYANNLNFQTLGDLEMVLSHYGFVGAVGSSFDAPPVEGYDWQGTERIADDELIITLAEVKAGSTFISDMVVDVHTQTIADLDLVG